MIKLNFRLHYDFDNYVKILHGCVFIIYLGYKHRGYVKATKLNNISHNHKRLCYRLSKIYQL